MICATSAFLVWPKESETIEKKLGEKNFKKHPKVSTLTLKLNVKLLEPFVGWSTLYKKIGHVEFLTYALTAVNEYWEALFKKYTCCFVSTKFSGTKQLCDFCKDMCIYMPKKNCRTHLGPRNRLYRYNI